MPRRAFTLIELLVVIAIVAVLAAILFPVFASAKAAAKGAANLSNLKQLALAHLGYSNDHDDAFALMSRFESEANQSAAFGVAAPMGTIFRGEIRWVDTVAPYAKSPALFVSPLETPVGGTELERVWAQGQFYGVVGRGGVYMTQIHGYPAPFVFGNDLVGAAYVDGPFGMAGSADAAYAMLRDVEIPSVTQMAVERVSDVVMVADAGAYDMGFGRAGHYQAEAHGPCAGGWRYSIGPSFHSQWAGSFYAGPWARRGVSGAYGGGRACVFEAGQKGMTAYAAVDGSAKVMDLRGRMYEKRGATEGELKGRTVLARLYAGGVQ